MGKKEPLVEKVVPSLEKQKSLLKNSKFLNIFQSSVVRIKMGLITNHLTSHTMRKSKKYNQGKIGVQFFDI